MSDLDLRPHALQFGSMHEAVLENCFRNYGTAVRLGHQRHVLSLHVRGKIWIRLSPQIARVQISRTATHMQCTLIHFFNFDPHFA